jgi:hypothetical protein
MHLKPEELVDLAEGTIAEASVPHLATCAACRGQLEMLRAMEARARDFDVPEPSPLFWDHLSSRVQEAIAADSAQPAGWLDRLRLGAGSSARAGSPDRGFRGMGSGWGGISGIWTELLASPRSWGIVVAAGVAVVVALGTISPLTHRLPGMGTPSSGEALPAVPDQNTIDSVAGIAAGIGLSGAPSLGSFESTDAGESSLGLVTDMTSGLDWDTANQAGLAGDGSAEHAVTHMTNDELRELQRLLKEELGRSGA